MDDHMTRWLWCVCVCARTHTCVFRLDLVCSNNKTLNCIQRHLTVYFPQSAVLKNYVHIFKNSCLTRVDSPGGESRASYLVPPAQPEQSYQTVTVMQRASASLLSFQSVSPPPPAPCRGWLGWLGWAGLGLLSPQSP